MTPLKASRLPHVRVLKLPPRLAFAASLIPAFIFVLLLLTPTMAGAQDNAPGTTTVKGQVTDEKGAPLADVSITLKGTNVGTATGPMGDFSIAVSGSRPVLLVSSVGYATQEIPVNNQQNLKIVLQPDAVALNSVVVVGFGTQKKVNLTGSVSSISSKDLASRPVAQLSAGLQGLAPGITVTQGSGRPGGDGGTIRIRGIGTLNDANPLVLIDGIEGAINSVDPNLVESVSVLKDAASASIYGSRAANGVILVTTKRAKGNRLSVAYNNYLGWQSPTNLPEIVNALDHMQLINVAYVNSGRAPLYSNDLIQKYITEGASNRDLYPDTDWQKEVLSGSGFMQNHFLSLNGGSEKIKFITSLGYLDQKGLYPTSGFKRYTLRNNADMIFSDKVNVRFDIQLSHSITTESGRGSASVFNQMNRIGSNVPGIFANGNWGEGSNGNNPIAYSRSNGGLQKNTSPNLLLNATLNYRPTKSLLAEFTVAPRYNESNDKNFARAVTTYKADGSVAFTSPAITSLDQSNSKSLYNNLRTTLTYTGNFGDHHLKVLGGVSREDYKNENFSASRDGFVLPDYPVLNTGSSSTQVNTGTASEWALQSVFGRINYDYKERYLLELNSRYDGSSRFARGKQYGFFPSVSAGWRVSEEAFFVSMKPVINDFKLRASWGQLGNQLIGTYPFTSSIVLGAYAMGGQIVNTAALNTMANPEISWETTEMTNIGLDARLFGNFSITADYYTKRTSDILYDLDIPLTLGLAKPYQNAGVVQNKGWELGVAYAGGTKDFRYDVNFNISDVQNKVVDLKGVNRTGITVSNEGYPINSLYGFEALGIFQSDDEVAKHAKQFGSVKAGDIIYKDQNGDGIINDADNIIIGSTIPRYTYSSTMNASYKGLNISLFLQGVGKANGYLYEQSIMPFFNGGTVHEQHKDYWSPQNPGAAFPRLAFGESNNEKNSSFWMKDAAYLRVKNLQLGYTIPGRLTQRGGIRNLRIYVNARNLFTWDNFWRGYDVETPVGTGNVYPQVKVYTFGVDVNF
ncbi:TonB-dependent receptor [Segetibacter sp. 3557_3]|uniref:SusC/RagA family TonB-linked outer membrane protein n=1 Tax=Segetibacter sp. 3557_3 TaxID=2547429 RepID=UPI0010590F9E|nr:TonB-dependent receptor [Segetibacter sp. 3557_3]TDH28643.1 TonB-dependent receptor [Segetibacter sp. 3557_3]